MFFMNKISAVLAERAVPFVAGAAMANPVAAAAVAAGTVGLAAWKGSEVAAKAAPLARKAKASLHKWSAEKVHDAAIKVADTVQPDDAAPAVPVQPAFTVDDLNFAVQTMIDRLGLATQEAEERIATAAQQAVESNRQVLEEAIHNMAKPKTSTKVNGGHAA